MKSGKCPKCGSSDIYKSHKISPSRYPGNRIMIKMGLMKNMIAILIHYVCVDCNYIESYVAENKESMKNIKEEWQPLNKQKRKRKNDEG